METLSWIAGNIEGIVAVLGAICLTASAITALTTTPKDDKIVGKLYRIVETLALVVGKAKDQPQKNGRK